MFLKQTGLAAFLVLSLGSALQAQSVQPRRSVDVSQLPIDFQRIHRQLRQATIREDRDGLNIRYVIEVYGQAPRLVVFTKDDNLVSGPVPYGGPTHQELVRYVTPQEHSGQTADIGALVRWLTERARK